MSLLQNTFNLSSINKLLPGCHPRTMQTLASAASIKFAWCLGPRLTASFSGSQTLSKSSSRDARRDLLSSGMIARGIFCVSECVFTKFRLGYNFARGSA
jgi:hypothetical protein